MKVSPWVAGGVGLVALGLVVWATAWVAWPASVVLIAIGIIRWIRGRLRERTTS
jgi:Flp pilus assembly protein TadB